MSVMPRANSLKMTDRSGWGRLLSRIIYSCVLSIVLGVMFFTIFKPIRVLPRIQLAPGFSFINADGASRNSDDFRGQVTLYSFTSLSHADLCKADLSSVDQLRRGKYNDELKLGFVTIVIDGDAGKFGELKKISDGFETSPAQPGVRWEFLVGGESATRQVVGGGFGVYYETGEKSRATAARGFSPVDARMVLVDGWGIIRAQYSISNLDSNRLKNDLNHLAAEARNAHGLARLAYEAAHLFRCYS